MKLNKLCQDFGVSSLALSDHNINTKQVSFQIHPPGSYSISQHSLYLTLHSLYLALHSARPNKTAAEAVDTYCRTKEKKPIFISLLSKAVGKKTHTHTNLILAIYLLQGWELSAETQISAKIDLVSSNFVFGISGNAAYKKNSEKRNQTDR